MPPAALPNRLNAIFISCIRISCAITSLIALSAAWRIASQPLVNWESALIAPSRPCTSIDCIASLMSSAVCGRWLT
jgi:hypothetical protein